MPAKAQGKKIYGILAEFDGTGDLLHAAEKMHGQGYSKWDAHSPFPIHGMDKAMGLGRSKLGFIVGFCSTAGLALFTYFLYWINVVDYPIVISGKPFFSFQAFVPPIFAITILSAALAATLGMFALNKLPMLFHPLFNSKQFERVTDGGFFISIQSTDNKFDEAETRKFLESIGGKNVEVVMQETEDDRSHATP